MKKSFSCLFFLVTLCFAEETQITSDRVEMVTGATENIFHFKGNVKVKGKDLNAESDEMSVFSLRSQNAEKKASEVGAIQKIIAKGKVFIAQTEREARAEYAEIYPSEGRLFLTGNPEVKEKDGIVRGDKITFLKGEKRAIVEGSKSNVAQRATVLLPEMADINLGPREKVKE